MDEDKWSTDQDTDFHRSGAMPGLGF